jgi:hypothetical protein
MFTILLTASVYSILHIYTVALFKDIVRRQIGKRGIKVFTGVGRLLRKGDMNGDGLINKFELEKSLVDFRIDVPQGVSQP